MNFSKRNKKVAIARWKKVHSKEKRDIPSDSNSIILKSALCGFIAGDGYISIRPENKNIHYDMNCYPDDKIMLKKYLEIIKQLYNKEPSVTIRDNVYHARLTSKVVVEDIIRLSNLGTKDWNLPDKLLKIEGAKEAWLKAFFSAEAYVGPRTIKIQTINKKGMESVSVLLRELDIEHRSYEYQPKRKNHSRVHMIFINKKEARTKYLEKIGFWHKKKEETLRKALNL